MKKNIGLQIEKVEIEKGQVKLIFTAFNRIDSKEEKSLKHHQKRAFKRFQELLGAILAELKELVQDQERWGLRNRLSALNERFGL